MFLFIFFLINLNNHKFYFIFNYPINTAKSNTSRYPLNNLLVNKTISTPTADSPTVTLFQLHSNYQTTVKEL